MNKSTKNLIISTVITFIIFLFLLSPFISISKKFTNKYYNSDYTNLIIEHNWKNNFNYVIGEDDLIKTFLATGTIDSASEHIPIKLIGNNPFKNFLTQESIGTSDKSYYVLSGSFTDSENTFNVKKWHNLYNDTTLLSTTLYNNNLLFTYVYIGFIFLFIISLISSLIILIKYLSSKKASNL